MNFHWISHRAVVEARQAKFSGPSEQQVDDWLVETMAVASLIEPVRTEFAVKFGTLGRHVVAFQGAHQPKVEHIAPVTSRTIDQLDVCPIISISFSLSTGKVDKIAQKSIKTYNIRI